MLISCELDKCDICRVNKLSCPQGTYKQIMMNKRNILIYNFFFFSWAILLKSIYIFVVLCFWHTNVDFALYVRPTWTYEIIMSIMSWHVNLLLYNKYDDEMEERNDKRFIHFYWEDEVMSVCRPLGVYVQLVASVMCFSLFY